MFRTAKQFLRGCACISLLVVVGLAASKMTLASTPNDTVAEPTRPGTAIEVTNTEVHP